MSLRTDGGPKLWPPGRGGAHAAAWLQSGPGSERKHMWRRIYAAVAPPAADCSALASEDDGALVVRLAQRPLRSPPGAASCLTMAAASTLFCALVIGTRPVRGDEEGIDDRFAF